MTLNSICMLHFVPNPFELHIHNEKKTLFKIICIPRQIHWISSFQYSLILSIRLKNMTENIYVSFL